jgi:hypothetical protein
MKCIEFCIFLSITTKLTKINLNSKKKAFSSKKKAPSKKLEEAIPKTDFKASLN